MEEKELQQPKVKQWQKVIFAYLQGRVNLKRVFLLVDARHGIKKVDMEVMEMLDKAAVTYQIILTKTDKISLKELNSLQEKVKTEITKHAAAYINVIATSSEKKQGLEQELKDVSKLLEQIEIELIQRMTDSEIDSFKRNGVLFSMVSREFESANPETKEELYKRFKDRGYENLFTINANTLSGFVKESKKENDGVLPDWMEGLINTFEKQSIRVKRN